MNIQTILPKPESNKVQWGIALISIIMFATTFAVIALVSPLLVGTANAKHNAPLMMIIALMIGMSTMGSLARKIDEKSLLRLSLQAFVQSLIPALTLSLASSLFLN